MRAQLDRVCSLCSGQMSARPLRAWNSNEPVRVGARERMSERRNPGALLRSPERRPAAAGGEPSEECCSLEKRRGRCAGGGRESQFESGVQAAKARLRRRTRALPSPRAARGGCAEGPGAAGDSLAGCCRWAAASREWGETGRRLGGAGERFRGFSLLRWPLAAAKTVSTRP